LQDAAANGREGLGTIQMVAAGNGRDASGNANTTNFTSSRFINAIAGISSNGEVASYSTPGASLLVASPTDGIFTTDYTGSVGYYSGDYTSTFNGTSAATPIASGVVGLILEANQALGYRDVMEILAISARQIGNPAGSGSSDNLRPWAFNGGSNWNNGGLHFSHDYGFGLIDAFAAVKLAESWNLQQTYTNELSTSVSNTSSGAVPDNNTMGISQTVNLTPASGNPITVEAIEVQINWSASHTWSGDLVIELTSPTGMSSYLLDRAGGSSDLPNWVFTTRAHLGELATGTWTVRVTDLETYDTGTISSITVRAYGSRDVDDNYYYTDEFGTVSSASAVRQTLIDSDGGIDTINLAALSTGASINLDSGVENVVAGSSFVIAAGTIIEGVIGSWSNDTIVGNTSNNILIGNAGNDSLRGGDYNPILTTHGQVYRLYLATLDRAPDEGGFANWATALANGTTLAEITTGFVNSIEFQARYGVLNNTQFVTLLYNNVLDRAPDSGGLANWVGALAEGATRESIINGFSESQEFVGNTLFANTGYVIALRDEVHLGQVYRLYLATLDRAPDEGGFANWATALANGTTLAEITIGFINSIEFQSRYGALNNTQFVTLLYNNVLDRTPDSGGLANWVGALAEGAMRESIVNGFSESQEFVGNTDVTLVGYMRSISSWRNTLDGGAGDDTLLGGRGVDTFVFNANEDGSDTVYGLDDWDMLRFENFGFTRSSDVFNFFSETNGEAVFSYQGVSITFDNTPLAGIDIGMVLI
jgi:subtilisin-like proprotein convertase family protein